MAADNSNRKNKISPRASEQSEESSYEKTAKKLDRDTERLYAALHYLARELDKRLLEPFLRDKHGRRLGAAPPCILTIQYTGRYRGFAAKAVWSNEAGKRLDQITLNFDRENPADVKEIASTQVHEKIHATMFADGTAPGGDYNCVGFRARMKSVGLQTSKTGRPGGASIGSPMSHYIIEGGPFDRVMDQLIAEGFRFPCRVARPSVQRRRRRIALKAADPSKTKFYCPECGQIARANYTAQLRCGRVGCANARFVTDK